MPRTMLDVEDTGIGYVSWNLRSMLEEEQMHLSTLPVQSYFGKDSFTYI
jgi:hypothetical protein